ncbi:MAG: VOC family protein [Thermoplasmata archaeon]
MRESSRTPSTAPPETRASHGWVGAVVIDCTDLPRMIEFWSAALDYVARDPPGPDGVVLKDPAGVGPSLSLCRGSEGPLGDYRLHLDVYVSDLEKEVTRLLGLGATLMHPRADGEDFVTLADPDGNPFDVIDKRGWVFGQRA